MNQSVKIGRIELQQTRQFTILYSYAAWYRRIECAPQTVDLYLTTGSTRELCFGFQGKVVASDFSPAFGGRAFASKVDSDLGELDTYHSQMYEYDFFGLLHNQDYRIVLDEGVEVTAKVKVLSRDNPTWAFTSVFAHIEPAVATVEGGR